MQLAMLQYRQVFRPCWLMDRYFFYTLLHKNHFVSLFTFALDIPRKGITSTRVNHRSSPLFDIFFSLTFFAGITTETINSL